MADESGRGKSNQGVWYFYTPVTGFPIMGVRVEEAGFIVGPAHLVEESSEVLLRGIDMALVAVLIYDEEPPIEVQFSDHEIRRMGCGVSCP